MILVGYWHGLRVSEIIHITRDSFSSGYLDVQRLKGSRRTQQELISHPDPLYDEKSALFDYARGFSNNQKLFPLTRQHFWRLFGRYCQLAHVPEHKAHPHILKHSIAMHVIEKAGIQNVKQYLGHKSGQSTMEYLKVTDSEASLAVRRAARGIESE